MSLFFLEENKDMMFLLKQEALIFARSNFGQQWTEVLL